MRCVCWCWWMREMRLRGGVWWHSLLLMAILAGGWVNEWMYRCIGTETEAEVKSSSSSIILWHDIEEEEVVDWMDLFIYKEVCCICICFQKHFFKSIFIEIWWDKLSIFIPSKTVLGYHGRIGRSNACIVETEQALRFIHSVVGRNRNTSQHLLICCGRWYHREVYIGSNQQSEIRGQ